MFNVLLLRLVELKFVFSPYFFPVTLTCSVVQWFPKGSQYKPEGSPTEICINIFCLSLIYCIILSFSLK